MPSTALWASWHSAIKRLALAGACGFFIACGVSGCSGLTSASSGSKPPAGALSANPASVAFGNVVVGSNASQSFTLTNSGTASVTVSQVSISNGSFSIVGLTLPTTVGIGQSVGVQLQFAPQVAGSLNATASITSNASSSPIVVSLSGTGTAPAISLNPSSLNFGSVSTGGSSQQSVNVTNSGNAPLTITAANITGPGFSVAGFSLPETIAPNQSTAFTVQFAPTSSGNASGSVSIVSNVPGSPAVLALSGIAIAGSVLTANPSSIIFGSTTVGTSSNQTLTLKNTGTSSVTISQVAASGAGFSMSGLSLPVTLGGGLSTTFTTTFTPSSTGAASGNLTIASTASNSTLVVGLSGIGTAPQPQLTLSVTSVSFGNVTLGSNATQPVTLTNSGSAPLTISSVSAAGGGFNWNGMTLPVTLAAGQGTSFNAIFAPVASGSASGSISIASNAPGPPASIALSGAGVQGQLAASSVNVSFGNILVGGNSTQTITLSNSGTASLTISQATGSGAEFSLSGLGLPLTLNGGANTSFTVTFAPTTAGNASGSVAITSNASNPSLTIILGGTGIQPQITATPSTVSFGSVATGSNSSQAITLSNPGGANLTITQATVVGTGFGMTGLNVPITINAGKNTTFNADFSPASTGSAAGSITIASNAPNSPMTIPLSGTGVAATLVLTATPPNLTFGNVLVGNTSSQNVTLTNTGNSNVTISQVVVAGAGYAASGVLPNTTLTPGQSTTLTVSLTPTSTGSATGSVTVTSNASNSPTTILLAGGSHLVDLSWTASTSTVVGYNVYRGTVSGGPYATKVNSAVVPRTAFTDTGVVAGQTYFYVVTAVDANGVESVYSNEASALVPTP